MGQLPIVRTSIREIVALTGPPPKRKKMMNDEEVEEGHLKIQFCGARSIT